MHKNLFKELLISGWEIDSSHSLTLCLQKQSMQHIGKVSSTCEYILFQMQFLASYFWFLNGISKLSLRK